jgi:hypothetical protein
MRKAFKTAIGLIFLPLLVSFSLAFYRQFGNMETAFTEGQKYFLGGIVTYCVFQLFLFKPAYLYTLGHEAVHVLATWLCLGKVTSFKVSPSGGSVTTSKSNIFILLSPYFVPIYSILLAITYYVVNDAFLLGFLTQPYFIFLLGLTLAFHIVMTIDTLKTKQPDLVKVGYLTSSILIYVMNLVVISGVLGLLFKSFSFTSFLNKSYFLSADIYRAIFRQLFL